MGPNGLDGVEDKPGLQPSRALHYSEVFGNRSASLEILDRCLLLPCLWEPGYKHIYTNKMFSLVFGKAYESVVEVLYFDKSQVKVPNPGSLERLISYVLIYFRLLAGYGGAGILIVS